MKKSIIAVTILLVGIASLPIIGNSVMKTTLDEKVSELKSYGIETKKDEIDSSYLSTSRHFEFELQDSKAFMSHLNQYSDKQVPAYTNAMLDGVKFGVDVEYSNLPFAKAVSLDLYPLALATELEDEIRIEDPHFLSYVEKFLSSKGLLYHIEYNFLNDDFKGNIKNINEKYTMKDGVKFAVAIKDATFSGNGELLAPQRVDSTFKVIQLNLEQNNKNLHVLFTNFKTSNNFESKITYVTSAELEKMEVKIAGTGDDGLIVLKKLRMNASSNDQGSKVELNSKTSAEEFLIDSPKISVAMKHFNIDVALNDLDKVTVAELTELLSDKAAMQQPKSQEKFQSLALELVSKGFVFNIADFSLKNIKVNKTEDFQGFLVQSKLTVKEDADLKDKMKMSPMMAIQNVELDTNITLSKKIYGALTGNRPMLASFRNFAKEDGENLIFKLEFKDSKATVNGKPLN